MKTILTLILLATSICASLFAAPETADANWNMFDRRIGMFVTWGIHSVVGRHSQIFWRDRMTRTNYEKLAERFTAEKFDADRFVDVAESAGAEYIVFVTKHHDGFCLWDTATTDYKVTNTPAKRDVLAELAAACRRRGMRLGLYYSNPDWHHPNAYNPKSTHQIPLQPGDEPDMEKYIPYVKAQVTELLTKYGEIVCLFWDIPTHIDRPDMDELARRLQPGIMINDRGWGNKATCDYSTPERDWKWNTPSDKHIEACDSVGAVSWAYRSNENYRTLGYMTRRIDKFLAAGGNFLLNVGPKSDGTIPEEAAKLMAGVGDWRRRVGDAFAGVATAKGVLAPSSKMIATRRGDSVFIHFPDGLDASGVDLDPIDTLPERATLLNTGGALKVELDASPIKGPKSDKKTLHVYGIPADDIANECAVIRLDFPPAATNARGNLAIWDDRPASADKRGETSADVVAAGYVSGAWERSWYPLGNGRLGCMVDGDPSRLRIQFNVDSLWTGDENLSSSSGDADRGENYSRMGSYQSFGELAVLLASAASCETAPGYRRELDLATAVYSDRFAVAAGEVRRRIFASAPDDAIFIDIDAPRGLEPRIALAGTHGEATAVEAPGAATQRLAFSGVLQNGLAYAARADVFQAVGDAERTRFVVVLRAKTGDATLPRCETAPDVEAACSRHVADYRRLFDRMTFSLGEGDASVPTRVRLERFRKGGADPSLVALQFNFGRYLLISCSRPGTLPANLQGIWNNSNKPAWHSDYHTNINLQMCYWGADPANLPECFEPLSDWMLRTLPVAEKGTRAAFPNARGYAYRTSANAVGGGGWRWNFAGAPWLAAQCYDHWRFTRDDKWLRNVCWPLMKGAAEFLISTQLKERPDGTVVVKNGWSPEHGPREDGVAHDQQVVRELFRSILAAAATLGIDDNFTREVARVEPKLLGDKIGSWGQLQEWEADRDVKGDDHRHTSHLYAVYPGTTISRKDTPELAEAARVALAGRATTGDSRREWVWVWRAILWARLGDGAKAGEMLENLLRYNTLDNMLATHPPFQCDGILGMVGSVCEILLEGAIPPQWPHGSATGLRTREGKTINVSW